jgi:hypothetical protein
VLYAEIPQDKTLIVRKFKGGEKCKQHDQKIVNYVHFVNIGLVIVG